jgi:hypothetical protein
MKALFYISVLSLFACKGKQVLQQEVSPVENRPSWVSERPISSLYYMGIGISNTHAPDYQDAAKKNALNDLASEISVNIEGNSLLYTLDRRYEFEEEFTSTVKATTSEQLEGFEVVDSWTDGQEYWVYYRLDKAEHARLKALRKKRAMEKAKDLYMKGEQNLRDGNIRESFNNHIRGLLAMKDHWNEEDLTELNGEQVYLGNLMFSRLQDMAAGIHLGVLPERAVLDLNNGFSRELRVEAQYKDNQLSVNLSQLPVLIETPRNGRVFTERKSTSNEGVLLFEVKQVSTDNKQVARVSVDLVSIVPSDLKDPLVKTLLGTLTSVQTEVPIDIVMPTLYLVSVEKNFGHELRESGVTGALKQALTERGFTFTNSADADLFIDLSASTRKGGETSGFYTAYLDLEIVFEKASDGTIIHNTSEKNIKGVQLNWEKAGSEAFRKGREQLEKRIVPEMVEALL